MILPSTVSVLWSSEQETKVPMSTSCILVFRASLSMVINARNRRIKITLNKLVEGVYNDS